MEDWGQTTNSYENPVCVILESVQKEEEGSDGVLDETKNRRILKTTSKKSLESMVD